MKRKISSIKFDSSGSTLTYTNAESPVWLSLPDPGPIEYHCYTCGDLIEGTIYIVVHGGGVQCKKCYLDDGHWQCSCNEEWMLLDVMKFCHQCGKERRK